jgi:hypothetical protein
MNLSKVPDLLREAARAVEEADQYKALSLQRGRVTFEQAFNQLANTLEGHFSLKLEAHKWATGPDVEWIIYHDSKHYAAKTLEAVMEIVLLANSDPQTVSQASESVTPAAIVPVGGPVLAPRTE